MHRSLVFLAVLAGFMSAAAQTAPDPAATNAPPTPSAQTAPATSAQDENARKARALLDQMIQALGGPAFMNMQDMSQDGRTYSFYHGNPTGAGAVYWRFWKWPDKDRIELTKQRDWVIITNGDNGYEVTYKGTAPQDKDQLQDYLRRRQYSLEWVLRKWLKEPGIALFYDGPTVAERKQADQVTIMNAKGDAVSIAMDTTTHLPLQKTFTWRDPTDRQKNEEFEVYDNYKPIQGIMTPLSITRGRNGDMMNQRFINTVKYNQNLPDSMFEAHTSYDPNAKRKKH
jgi:hypothetical protein